MPPGAPRGQTRSPLEARREAAREIARQIALEGIKTAGEKDWRALSEWLRLTFPAMLKCVPRARDPAAQGFAFSKFTVVLYGARIFWCKTMQSGETPRQYACFGVAGGVPENLAKRTPPNNGGFRRNCSDYCSEFFFLVAVFNRKQ